MAVVSAGPGCGSTSAEALGGTATVVIDTKMFEVSDVRFSFATGEDGYFRIEGADAAHPNQDCLPGLSGGLALYGDLPRDVTTLRDFSGKELPFEFSSDGDDANLCFVGSNGLLGVEQGTVRFEASEGEKMTFSFAGSFTTYDGEGGTSSSTVNASGSGVARAVE
jgi:hypothetical protein